jgi:carbamoylphosphate synthase large subunit
MKRILVFPCGSEIGLEIHRSLSNSKHFELFGGNTVDDHGKFVYTNYIPNIPFIDEDNFIESINGIIKENKIDFIIPAHDSVVLKMAKHQNEINSRVITSTHETCEICRSKLKTYKRFEGIINIPRIYETEDEINFPVFLKPEVGQGSKGTFKVYDKKNIEFYLGKDPTLLILEYLPGKEYTVDCFTDRSGNLLFSEGRERYRINNGISVNSKPVKDLRFKEIAEKINNTISFRGVWFFQVKERSSGDLVLMEIAPRIAGTMGLYRNMGINFTELSLFDAMNLDVDIILNNLDLEIDRALVSKFNLNYDYDTIYIDFDDTIIVNESVNLEAIKFIYQSKNLGKSINIITRHKKNLEESLSKFFISRSIFDQIFVIKDDESKSDYIKSKNSIFIDDSFRERKDVFEKSKIPVFGIDAIECLLL